MGFLSHNSYSRDDRRSIKGSENANDHLVSKTTLSQKMAHWIGAQRQSKLVKNSKTPPLVTSPQENHKPKTEKIFSVETRRLAESIEGLNSPLAIAADELCPKKCWTKKHYSCRRGRKRASCLAATQLVWLPKSPRF